MPDIFDRLTEEKEDVFDGVEQEDSAIENVKSQVVALLEKFDAKDRKNENRKLSDEIKDFIREEIAKIKPKQNVIERTIEKKIIEPRHIHVEPRIVEAPPQIVKEVRVEVLKADPKQAQEIAALKKQIEDLKAKLEEPKNPVLPPNWGFRTGKIIPSLSGNDGKYLKAVGSKLVWETVQSNGGGLSGYTVNNPNELKTFDVADISLDELARVVASIITDLQA